MRRIANAFTLQSFHNYGNRELSAGYDPPSFEIRRSTAWRCGRRRATPLFGFAVHEIAITAAQQLASLAGNETRQDDRASKKQARGL